MTHRPSARRGVTLAELMVVIVILGVMAGVTGVAFATRTPVPDVDARLARVANARADAVRIGRPVTLPLAVNGASYLVTAFPDGRIVTDAPIPINRLSGRPDHAAR